MTLRVLRTQLSALLSIVSSGGAHGTSGDRPLHPVSDFGRLAEEAVDTAGADWIHVDEWTDGLSQTSRSGVRASKDEDSDLFETRDVLAPYSTYGRRY